MSIETAFYIAVTVVGIQAIVITYLKVCCRVMEDTIESMSIDLRIACKALKDGNKLSDDYRKLNDAYNKTMEDKLKKGREWIEKMKEAQSGEDYRRGDPNLN